jgi:hypothetical protein
VLAHFPKFQAILDRSRRQIEDTGGIPHEEFWRQVDEETRTSGNRGKRKSARTNRSS